MYSYGYRRRGFGFSCLPIILGALFLMMLVSGGFHPLLLFVWPLFFMMPIIIVGGAIVFLAMHWGWHGEHSGHQNSDQYFGEKRKRGGDPDSEIYYL